MSAGTIIVIFQQWRQIGRLADQNATLREGIKDLPGLKEENQKLLSRVEESDEVHQSEHDELLRRRAQASQLKELERENTLLRAERDRLATASAQSGLQSEPNANDDQSPEQKRLSDIVSLGRNLGAALLAAAEANSFQLPGELSPQFLLAIDALSKTSSSTIKSDRFELVYKGSFLDVKDSLRTILFREKEATNLATGEWVKTYGFADGHIETIKVLDPNEFARLEKQLQPGERK